MPKHDFRAHSIDVEMKDSALEQRSTRPCTSFVDRDGGESKDSLAYVSRPVNFKPPGPSDFWTFGLVGPSCQNMK